LRPGDTVTLTTTLSNLNDESVAIPLDDAGVLKTAPFQDGRALRRQPEPAGARELIPQSEYTNLPGLIQSRYRTGIDRYAHIPARSSCSYRMTGTLIAEKGKCFLELGHSPLPLRFEVPIGLARFRMVHVVPDDAAGGRTRLTWEKTKEEAIIWTGTLRSNDVLLKILPPEPGYVPPIPPAAPAAVPMQFIY
jgi:hypothetical protein